MSVVLRFWTESTLDFRQVFPRDSDEVVEDDPNQDFPGDGQEKDAPVVATVCLIASVLAEGVDCVIPAFLRHILLFLDAGEE